MYAIVTVLTIAINVWAALADVVRAKFVLANSSELGIAPSWIPLLAALKAVGAAGLLAGLLGVRPLGVAAAAGLVLFFAGALVVHTRARVFHNIAAPGIFFALAVASLVLAVTG
ncbi:DoxX-like family protein [Nonomuraea solani]|uniref:DoxX-like family protein n=1 Tax=Nonomuraea solani TaxID=1144553 RepID=A0A1H6BTM3_9ACTN|nr:DoxX family protein [Nonomuraea solani]SEG64054.1 DoxX-like family protein [Nonomuraea solani]